MCQGIQDAEDREGDVDDDAWFRFKRLGIRVQDRQQTRIPPRHDVPLEVTCSPRGAPTLEQGSVPLDSGLGLTARNYSRT